MRINRRQFIAAVGAVGCARKAPAQLTPPRFTPEMFGAKGDGRTNDTQAFAAMSAQVNARGGGMIVLRPTTYIVGEQIPSRGGRRPSFVPTDIIRLEKCVLPISILGNGAKLRAAPGLRYGRFDAKSGQPLAAPVGKRSFTNQAVPYFAMIDIRRCQGDISISDIELDGNLAALWIGGGYGKGGGWSGGGTGIRLFRNGRSERLSRIHTHHHPQDGLYLAAPSERTAVTSVSDVNSEFNGRQGCSVTSGNNFLFQRCKFHHTGKAVLHSNPSAGVDVEAGFGPIRNVAFSNCEFVDNQGFGFVAGSGDAADISFRNCKFVGTTNWSAWPDQPAIRFENCLFVGAMNHAHGDVDPARAVQFVRCTFSDDKNLSPTGEVFLPRRKWIAVVERPNVRFEGCDFRLTGAGLLPRSNNNVIYENCFFSQRSNSVSTPRGTYRGHNVLNGAANLSGSNFLGSVILNGKQLNQADK